MFFRSDLALEVRETLPQSRLEGVQSSVYQKNAVKITVIKIINEEGEKLLSKPKGTYVTFEMPPLTEYSCTDEETVCIIASELEKMLPEDGTVLIVGIGNEDITPDSLGPECCSSVLATRHISSEIMKSTGLGNLRKTAVFSAGVLGKTGVETLEIIKSLVSALSPSAVIVIDAFASRRLSRLGCTVQMSDTGIVPGSGIGNSRKEISEKTLGVPVICIGVPTVVDANTFVSDLSGGKVKCADKNMIVTPKEIDLLIKRAASLVSMSINKALQKHIGISEMLMLTGG